MKYPFSKKDVEILDRILDLILPFGSISYKTPIQRELNLDYVTLELYVEKLNEAGLLKESRGDVLSPSLKAESFYKSGGFQKEFEDWGG